MGKKNFLLALALLVGFTGSALAIEVPVESNAVVSDTKDKSRVQMLSLIDPAVDMIIANGWRCDSVSSLVQYAFSRGFHMSCNQFQYDYEFEDKGGNWTVRLK